MERLFTRQELLVVLHVSYAKVRHAIRTGLIQPLLSDDRTELFAWKEIMIYKIILLLENQLGSLQRARRCAPGIRKAVESARPERLETGAIITNGNETFVLRNGHQRPHFEKGWVYCSGMRFRQGVAQRLQKPMKRPWIPIWQRRGQRNRSGARGPVYSRPEITEATGIPPITLLGMIRAGILVRTHPQNNLFGIKDVVCAVIARAYMARHRGYHTSYASIVELLKPIRTLFANGRKGPATIVFEEAEQSSRHAPIVVDIQQLRRELATAIQRRRNRKIPQRLSQVLPQEES